MNKQELFALIQEFLKSGLTALEIDGERVRMEKTAQTAAPLSKTVCEEAAVQPSGGIEVKSPIVGVFYASQAPDAPPLVNVGDSVKKGQPLCVLEAMKMMNELPSPADGVITKILARDGDAVSFDQALFEVTP